jgi:hypothetical protein
VLVVAVEMGLCVEEMEIIRPLAQYPLLVVEGEMFLVGEMTVRVVAGLA